MSDRWVIPSWFKVQATGINWPDEAGMLGFEGPHFETGMDPAFLHFRWMLHPSIGLPRFPFTIWHMPHPGGDLDTQQLANHDGWAALEFIGLPIDESWDDTEHHMSRQGPVDNPGPPMDGTLSPVEAALRRLRLGAPRIGWAGLSLNGIPLDEWKSPDLEAYLDDLLNSRHADGLLHGIHQMLRDRPNALDHAEYVIPAGGDAGQEALHPHLLLNGAVALRGENRPARGEWGPLGLLLVAAGTDPLAALALGFGTSLNNSSEDLYMVTVQHRLSVDDVDFDFILADVVSINQQLRAPNPPDGLKARLIGGTRPQVVDGPALQSIGVSWNRPENPIHTPQPDDPFPASYAVGRFGPHPVQAEILLARRSETLGGWLPFVASEPEEVRPVLFTDHIVRLSNIGGQPFADPHGLEVTYAVAAQDSFGRWSPWKTIPFRQDGERPQAPSILSVEMNPSGQVSIEFAWDWSDRSPEFVELVGAYADDPASPLFTERVQFGGEAEPAAGGAQVIPLDPDRQPAAGWGEAQDRNPTEPEVRFYRLSAAVSLDFAGRSERIFQAQARGQGHLHKVWGAAVFNPGFNVSPFGRPVSTRLYDPAPPPAPAVPEAPKWASLRDAAGVSRIRLKWSGDPRVAGYVLYEATETALLAALGLPGPDTSQPFTDRLAVLRAANLPALRRVFGRVQKELIPPTTPETSYEAALPRGSAVIHFFAVTAVSHNQVESAWPESSKKFIAVAVPRLAVPMPPTLLAEPDPAQPAVGLRVGLGPGVPASQVELYRAASEELAKSADTMGPPLATLAVAGPEITFTDDSLATSWRRRWYRAVAWSSRDDQRGLVEARSPASPPVSVLLPPPTAPDVSDLRANEPGSTDAEALVSWTSQAPVEVTPLGPHTAVLEARDASGGLIARLEERLDALTAVNSLAELPSASPVDRKIIRVGPSDSYRLYAWLPRPPGLSFGLTVKMIDPLGRIGSTQADVLQLALVHTPQLSPISFSFDPILSIGEAGDVVSHWEILSPIQQETLHQYRFSVLIDQFVHQVGGSILLQLPIEVDLSLDQVGEPATLVEHVPGTQQYFIQHRFDAEITEVAVTVKLTDPLGRSASQSANLLVVSVPDVRGWRIAEAMRKLEDTRLRPEEAPTALVDPDNRVVESLDPEQGTLVPAGRRVVVFPMDAAPGITGINLGEPELIEPGEEEDPWWEEPPPEPWTPD